jgi:hypothetical protein
MTVGLLNSMFYFSFCFTSSIICVLDVVFFFLVVLVFVFTLVLAVVVNIHICFAFTVERCPLLLCFV